MIVPTHVSLALLLSFMISLVMATQQVLQMRKAVSGVDNVCIITKCGFKLAKCMLDSDCRKCTECMQKCAEDDALCSSNCFFQYATPLFNEFTQCAVNNKCLPPLTWSNTTCPDWKSRKLTHSFDVSYFADIQEMYVARGSHPIYDCLPCQKLSFQHAPSDPSAVQTTWSTYIEPVERNATYILKQESPNSIVTNYLLFGMPVEEHYYVMDYTEDYVYYFYCGYGYGGEYQGSLVYSRYKSTELPGEVYDRFSKVLQDNDLGEYVPSLDGYCQPKYPGNCANIH